MMTIDSDLDLQTPEQQLLSAIDNNEFELYYQPLVDVRDHSIYGVEALVRWNHPERGLLLPADFIELAEETGLIVPLGNWVLRQACTDFQILRAVRPNLLLSVNVSSRQLDELDFVAQVSDTLRQTAMPHHLLQLEITESIFLRDSMRVGALLQAIRALGVKIAFDDFGTGYSSLNYIERYPVDTLKVDQYFVQRIGRGQVSNDIVQHIVGLAHTIGMDVTAEGVESEEQAAALESYGCNIAQGFLFSRPVPLRALKLILEDQSMEAFDRRRKDARSAGVDCRASLARQYSAA